MEQRGAGHRPLDAAGAEAVVQVLAGQLAGRLSLLAAAEEHDERVEQTTRDQVRVLQHLRLLGFKGLERSVVVLRSTGFKQPERAREMLYVGLSRARTLLVGPRALPEQVEGRRRGAAATGRALANSGEPGLIAAVADGLLVCVGSPDAPLNGAPRRPTRRWDAAHCRSRPAPGLADRSRS